MNHYPIKQPAMNTGYGRAYWGPRLWYLLHKISYSYPERANLSEQQFYYNYFNLTKMMIPCPFCSNHYNNAIQTKLLDRNLNTRQEVIDWFRNQHNDVNIGNNRRIYQGFEVDYLYNGVEFNHEYFFELLDYLYRLVVVSKEINRVSFIRWILFTYKIHPCVHCRISSERFLLKNNIEKLKYSDNNVLKNWLTGLKSSGGQYSNIIH